MNYGFELLMSTHQFEMTCLGVFLSVLSNVSLFIQWITVSFTKAFSFPITGVNEPHLSKTKFIKSFIDRAISPEKFLAEIFFPVVF